MDRVHIRLVQRKLTEFGDYSGAIDGIRGDMTHAAVVQGMDKLGQGVPDGFADWSGKRQTTAFLQAYAQSEGIDAGAIDGLYGPQTDFAADALDQKLTTGSVRHFVDETAEAKNPNEFPPETRSQSELIAFYGQPGKKDGSNRPLMERVPMPWTMKLAWDKSSKRSFLWAHKKTVPSLKRVLERIDAAYSDAQVSDLGLDLFGGDYNPRIMKGATRASLHSWGIAYDFDPARNSLHANRHQARLGQRDAIPFWEAWESEGWCSLGRVRNYDWMHVQAAARAY